MEPNPDGLGADQPVDQAKAANDNEPAGRMPPVAIFVLVLGSISFVFMLLFLGLGAFFVQAGGYIRLVPWAIISLPMVAVNGYMLVKYGRRMKSPAGQAISTAGALSSIGSLIGLSVVAMLISLLCCSALLPSDFWEL